MILKNILLQILLTISLGLGGNLGPFNNTFNASGGNIGGGKDGGGNEFVVFNCALFLKQSKFRFEHSKSKSSSKPLLSA